MADADMAYCVDVDSVSRSLAALDLSVRGYQSRLAIGFKPPKILNHNETPKTPKPKHSSANKLAQSPALSLIPELPEGSPERSTREQARFDPSSQSSSGTAITISGVSIDELLEIDLSGVPEAKMWLLMEDLERWLLPWRIFEVTRISFRFGERRLPWHVHPNCVVFDLKVRILTWRG